LLLLYYCCTSMFGELAVRCVSTMFVLALLLLFAAALLLLYYCCTSVFGEVALRFVLVMDRHQVVFCHAVGLRIN
jgi:hypothetical protein